MDSRYFSINIELVPTQRPLVFDIYINSSKSSHEHYIRIFPKNEVLSKKDIFVAKSKYAHLYVPEAQRVDFMREMVQGSAVTEVEKGKVIKDAAISYLETLFSPKKEFSTEILSTAIQGCKDSVSSMVDVIENYSLDDLQGLIGQLSFHDFYTYDHSINVAMYCISVFKALNPNSPREELVHAGLGGMLHDLGKLKIATSIINWPEKLTDEQFAEIKKHPEFGKELIRTKDLCQVGQINFDIIARVIHEHHENFNGTGYPRGIKGEEIHPLARITAIADFFDAVTTKRSYHEVVTVEEALSIMRNAKGKKIDPIIFDLFEKHVHGIKKKIETRNLSLPEDFDPCQPHKKLALHEGKDFGKIKILEESSEKKKSA